jgi:hypothetical protein
MESPHRTAERIMTPTAIVVAVEVCSEPAAYGGFFIARVTAVIVPVRNEYLVPRVRMPLDAAISIQLS